MKRTPKKQTTKPVEEPQAETKLPKGIETTFKLRPNLKEVYLSEDGSKWFFDRELADQVLGKYNIIKNPFI
jgi:hypothetical protein